MSLSCRIDQEVLGLKGWKVQGFVVFRIFRAAARGVLPAPLYLDLDDEPTIKFVEHSGKPGAIENDTMPGGTRGLPCIGVVIPYGRGRDNAVAAVPEP
jgi:hypothetical protein